MQKEEEGGGEGGKVLAGAGDTRPATSGMATVDEWPQKSERLQKLGVTTTRGNAKYKKKKKKNGKVTLLTEKSRGSCPTLSWSA